MGSQMQQLVLGFKQTGENTSGNKERFDKKHFYLFALGPKTGKHISFEGVPLSFFNGNGNGKAAQKKEEKRPEASASKEEKKETNARPAVKKEENKTSTEFMRQEGGQDTKYTGDGVPTMAGFFGGKEVRF